MVYTTGGCQFQYVPISTAYLFSMIKIHVVLQSNKRKTDSSVWPPELTILVLTAGVCLGRKDRQQRVGKLSQAMRDINYCHGGILQCFLDPQCGFLQICGSCNGNTIHGALPNRAGIKHKDFFSLEKKSNFSQIRIQSGFSPDHFLKHFLVYPG